MILCDGNCGMGAYGMDLTRAKPGNHLVLTSIMRDSKG